LGLFLEDSSQLKDSYLVELISKMLNCLDSLHKNSIYHQGLNPNSFVVDPKGNVKLTLFGTLEHRLYHHFPAIGNENPSIQNAIRFYSPERKENYGVVNQSSEYYSFGLIIWYLLCVQRNLSSHRDLVLSFPDFSFTGSIWDNVLEACLNEDRKKRPKSVKEILALLPKVDEGNTVLKPKKEEIPASPKKVTISFFNYNSFHHEIKVDGNSIENYNYQISGRKLTIEVEEGVEFQVFMKKDGSFLTSFTSSKRWQYTLPGNFDEGRTYIPEPTKTDSKSNSILYIVIAVLLLVVFILLFRQCRKESNTTENASDNATSIALISTKNEIVDNSKTDKSKVESPLPSELKPIPLPSPKPPDPKLTNSDSIEISAFKPVLYLCGITDGVRFPRGCGGNLILRYGNEVPKKYQYNTIVRYSIGATGLKASLEGIGSQISAAHLSMLKTISSGKCSISVRYVGATQGTVTAMFYL
jgi:serine/threonine protein kinase